MNRTGTSTPIAFAMLGVILALGATSGAEETESVAYELTEEASYQEGCFDPCLCPIMMATNLSGTFSLTPLVINGTYDTYEVADVDWNVSLADGQTWSHITGGGTLTIFSEFAVIQRLELDLAMDDESTHHFDSGPVASTVPLPELDLTISMNEMFCYDIAMRIAAKPATDPCPCDLDGDTAVGFGDLTQLVLHWGACEPAPLACMGDVDHTGSVGFGDLTALLTSWGGCME